LDYIGTHNYTIIYAGNNDTYNFAFYFKTIQITKVFIEPNITKIGAGSSTYQNKNEGFVGDTFAFVAALSESLPSGYNMYISFEGVNSNGSNSGYYGTPYQMTRRSDKVYYYKKVIQKAGSNRHYKIFIKKANGNDGDYRIGTYTVKEKPITDVLQINSYSIVILQDAGEYEKFRIHFSLSQKPKVVSLKSDTGNIYTFYKDGREVKLVNWANDAAKFDAVFNKVQKINDKEWILEFSIKKLDHQQNKSFTLVAQDYRAKNSTELVKTQIEPFIVGKKVNSFINVTADSLSKKIPASFNFDIKVDSNTNGLRVETSKGESAKVIKGKGGFPDGNINISVIDNTTWKVTYDVSSLSPTTATSNSITLTFYTLDSNGNVLAQKNITVKAYKKTKDNLQTILNFLNKSSVLKNLDLGNSAIRYSHFSRAEASIILYEFLKLKNPNFDLPYKDVGLYKNPFADIDPNSDYYKSVITLANYKGDDNVTVLTDKFGVFNPLHNVTRFQFVKMIVEGLNLTKSTDFSNIQGFSDYSKLANDAKIYYSTAVKDGLIKGDNNKLLPYDKLTVFQALTILGRALNKNFTSNANQFNDPNFANGEIGNPLGVIPEDQDYDPTVTPIKISDITTQKDGNCTKLTAVATVDSKAKGKGYYVWSANFGYFKKTTPNNKEVLFCPSTRKPNVNYKIHLLGGDRYMNFATADKNISSDNFTYLTNIVDDKNSTDEIDSNISLSVKNSVMKEGHLFVIDKKGSLYEHNLNIGLEKVAVTLQNEDGKTYSVDNVKWDNNSIYFIVPSVKEFYGKFVTVRVDYGTNDKYETRTLDQIIYQENFIINGTVQPDKTGNYPQSVTINSNKVSVEDGKFMYIAPKGGDYTISVNKNYQTTKVTLTDTNSESYVYLNYDGYTSTTMPLDKYPNDSSKLSDRNSSNVTPVITNTSFTLNEDSSNNILTLDTKNIDAQTMSVNIITNPAHGVVSVSNGKISYTPNANYAGTDSFVVKLVDGSGKVIEKTISVNIPNVNDAPVILNNFNTLYLDANKTSQIVDINISDVDGDDLNLSVETNDSSLVTLNSYWLLPSFDGDSQSSDWLSQGEWNGVAQELNITAKSNVSGVANVIVRLTDSSGTQVMKDFNVSVNTNTNTNIETITLKKGWSLISADINLTKIPQTISIVWEYVNGKWSAYSPNKNIEKTIVNNSSIDVLTSITSDKGTWVHATQKVKVDIQPSQPIFGYKFSDGWTLAGTSQDIGVEKVECNNGLLPLSIWKYSNGKWSLHTNVANNLKYGSFDTINKNEGFWVNCK